MSSVEVTDRFVEAIEAGYDLIVVNYANPDMVGHTGDMAAAMKAVEAIDQCLDVIWRCAAATAHQVQPSFIRPFLDFRCEGFRCFREPCWE